MTQVRRARADLSWKRPPPALPEIGREAPAAVCAPLVVSLPWRVTARCPIVDPDLAPGRSAIPVLVAAMVLTARRLLPFLVLGRSNSILLLGRSNSVLRLHRARGRDRCLPRPRRVALGAGAGSEKRRIDAARRWSGAAADSNGSDCIARVQRETTAKSGEPRKRDQLLQASVKAWICGSLPLPASNQLAV